MEEQNILIKMIKENISEINELIDELYLTTNYKEKNRLLNNLRKKISNIEIIAENFKGDTNDNSNIISAHEGSKGKVEQQQNTVNQRTFTKSELATFNGKNGNKAYVAVNGTVYDVTDVPAWAAASHFGLTAGTDVSKEFSRCHAGQQILNRLKVVGKMAQ